MAALPSTLDADSDNITRVILWCVPRVTSTSFLKFMTYVPNSQVWLEPYLMAHHWNYNRSEVFGFFDQTWRPDGVEEREFGTEVTGTYI